MIDVISLTRELVQIESTDPGTYEEALGEFFDQWFSRIGILSASSEVLPGRRNRMVELPGESSGPAMIWICHMDTVPIGEGWRMPPLSAELADGRIYGRGACDMKAGLACAMAAFAEIAVLRKRLSRPLRLIATVDEEDQMRGVEAAVQAGWVDSDSWVLDLEPTGGEIQMAHKGRFWSELSVRGVTAHASRPETGADAIRGIAEAIHTIGREMERLPVHPELGGSTVTFGRIEGGHQPYVVPDFCRVSIDMRLSPPTGSKQAEEILRRGIAAAESAVPGVSGSYQVTGDRPYVERNEDSPLLHALRKACREAMGIEPVTGVFPGYTDTAVIAGMLGNSNCMSYGPGDLGLAHKPDESVACEDILRCHRVMKCLAEQLLQDPV